MRAEGPPVEIVGAGPAGLAAAITLVQAGRQVIVHEMQREVGHRFGGDFQGMENWTGTADALGELRDLGISTTFRALPCREGTAYDAWNRAYPVRSREPLFYLVERGPGDGTLDTALLEQARSVGVEVRFGSRAEALEGEGILACGPKAADAIAVGYHFETDLPDGFRVVLDDAIAPQGYAYLLVAAGRATLKTCMFSDFRNERSYVERTLARFRQLVGLDMRNPVFHGGVGNIRLPSTAMSGRHPVAGEQAGFQDAFAGFGMRYAIRSGVMAARSLIAHGDYDASWRPVLGKAIDASIVNRVVYGALGNRGYAWMLAAQARRGDSRAFLRWLYHPGWVAQRLAPWGRRRYRSLREDRSCAHIDCRCIWCRHGGNPDGSIAAGAHPTDALSGTP